MSAFAGKQTFRTINSNVRFILKADGQAKVITGSDQPKADIELKTEYTYASYI